MEDDFEAYYSSAPAGEFATAVTVNNIQVGFLAFASGILLCVVTAFILVNNGANVGQAAGLFAAAGEQSKFYGLILPHGLLELSAIVVAGGAGLAIGWAIVDPGRPEPHRGARRARTSLRGDRARAHAGVHRRRFDRGLRHAEPPAHVDAHRDRRHRVPRLLGLRHRARPPRRRAGLHRRLRRARPPGEAARPAANAAGQPQGRDEADQAARCLHASSRLPKAPTPIRSRAICARAGARQIAPERNLADASGGRAGSTELAPRRRALPYNRPSCLEVEVGVDEARGELVGGFVEDDGAQAAEASAGASTLLERHRGGGGPVGVADVAGWCRRPPHDVWVADGRHQHDVVPDEQGQGREQRLADGRFDQVGEEDDQGAPAEAGEGLRERAAVVALGQNRFEVEHGLGDPSQLVTTRPSREDSPHRAIEGEQSAPVADPRGDRGEAQHGVHRVLDRGARP